MKQSTAYKDGKELVFNDSPAAREALEQGGWKFTKPRKTAKKKPAKKAE